MHVFGYDDEKICFYRSDGLNEYKKTKVGMKVVKRQKFSLGT